MKKLIIRGMDNRYFSQKVVEWYHQNKRELPWRQTKDPYIIWLSEIILQQTRVVQGLPYFKRFTEAFPTIQHLANAREQDVLRFWQGLGYYTRARNLCKCAHSIVHRYGGKFPQTYAELLRLPGIGPYTAAAIASISFNEPVAVVDGNVFRVLARVFGVEDPVNSSSGKKIFSQLANQLIDPYQPALHNQAVMEFGALHCVPGNPACEACVLRKGCVAFQKNLQPELPVKNRIKRIRRRYFYYVVFRKGNSLLMKQRIGKDIWHGLFDFYLLERRKSVSQETLVREDAVLKGIVERNGKFQLSRVYKHVLSHQIILARFIIVPVSGQVAGLPKFLKSFSVKKIAGMPKSVLINRFLHDYQFLKLQ